MLSDRGLRPRSARPVAPTEGPFLFSCKYKVLEQYTYMLSYYAWWCQE